MGELPIVDDVRRVLHLNHHDVEVGALGYRRLEPVEFSNTVHGITGLVVHRTEEERIALPIGVTADKTWVFVLRVVSRLSVATEHLDIVLEDTRPFLRCLTVGQTDGGGCPSARHDAAWRKHEGDCGDKSEEVTV